MGVIKRIKRYEREEGLLEGIQKGMEKELVRAEVEKFESARKFKSMGMKLKDIAEGLGLCIEEVEKL